jgi:hypothetical protein
VGEVACNEAFDADEARSGGQALEVIACLQGNASRASHVRLPTKPTKHSQHPASPSSSTGPRIIRQAKSSPQTRVEDDSNGRTGSGERTLEVHGGEAVAGTEHPITSVAATSATQAVSSNVKGGLDTQASAATVPDATAADGQTARSATMAVMPLLCQLPDPDQFEHGQCTSAPGLAPVQPQGPLLPNSKASEQSISGKSTSTNASIGSAILGASNPVLGPESSSSSAPFSPPKPTTSSQSHSPCGLCPESPQPTAMVDRGHCEIVSHDCDAIDTMSSQQLCEKPPNPRRNHRRPRVRVQQRLTLRIGTFRLKSKMESVSCPLVWPHD